VAEAVIMAWPIVLILAGVIGLNIALEAIVLDEPRPPEELKAKVDRSALPLTTTTLAGPVGLLTCVNAGREGFSWL
jgi:hypothetical protein